MSLLARSQLRFFRFAPWSTLTVLLGVTLAISSIVAVHQISQRVVVSLESVTPPHLAGVTHQLRRSGMTMDDYFELRARWRAGGLPGVSALMPVVTGTAGTWRIIGADAFSGVPAVLGLALLAPGQVLVNSDGEGAIQIDGRTYEVARTVAELPKDLLLTDIGTAQVALGRPDDSLDAIGVVVTNTGQALNDWIERLMPGFSAGIGFETFRLDGFEVTPTASADPALAFSRSVLFNLGALGSLALVVAWLLVYQVSVIWLRRRAITRERLMQMGVTEAELRRLFLLSLGGLGVVASLLGLFLGAGLANILARAVTGFSDALPAIPLDRWVVGKAMGSALLVCLIGGWLACRRESPVANPRIGGGIYWTLSALIVLAGAHGLFMAETLLGGFAAIAGVAVLALVSISPLLSGLKKLSRHLRGSLLSRMGLRELLWYPGDLAIAIGALVLALATSVAMALMVDSFRSDFEAMLEQRVVNDLFVSAGAGRDLSALADQLEALPGVSRVQRYGQIAWSIEGRTVTIGYSGFDQQEGRRYGLPGPLPPGAALVSERLARELELAAGARLLIEDLPLTVAAVFPGYGDSTPRLIVRTEDAVRLGVSPRFDRLSIDAEAPPGLMDVIREWAPGVDVEAQGAIRDRALGIFDQTFAITRALTFLALIVASVGLYNALLALELLQQPARHLLHTMGLTAGEARIIAGWRVIGIGGASLVLALPLGVLMGWLLCAVINPRAFGWSLVLQLQSESFLWPLCSALLVMILVGLAPTPKEPGEEAGQNVA